MTRQAMEKIDFCGETYLTNSYPLEQFAGVDDVLAAHRNRNTGCRRGYVGHWCIENDMLFLCDVLTVLYPRPAISLLPQLRRLLPTREESRVVAVWYSGKIELRAYNPWFDPVDRDQAYVKYQVVIEAGRLCRIEQFPLPDRPAEMSDVSYEDIPLFLRRQAE